VTLGVSPWGLLLLITTEFAGEKKNTFKNCFKFLVLIFHIFPPLFFFILLFFLLFSQNCRRAARCLACPLPIWEPMYNKNYVPLSKKMNHYYVCEIKTAALLM
jgi:hypothetical protein